VSARLVPMLAGIGLAALLLASSAAAAESADFAAELLALINAYRIERGLNRLAPDQDLRGLAAGHSRAMRREARLSHDGFAGRFERSGKSLCVENVGWNAPTPQAQLARWRDSPGHDQNLLEPRLTAAGVAADGPYVTFFACR